MVAPTSARRVAASAARHAPEGVFILSGARTPTGAFNGALAKAAAPQLAGTAIKAAVERAGVSPADVEEVFVGNVVQAAVGQSPARQAAFAAGLPDHTEAITINKVCASGMKSLTLMASTLALGERRIGVAGGMESMSQAPFYVRRGDAAGFGHKQLLDSLVLDGLFDVYNRVAMGVCAEKTAADLGIGREEQDDYAVRSYRLAGEAWARGAFDAEIAPVTIANPRRRAGAADTVVSRDEGFEPFDETKARALRPVFQKDGTVTAANASSLADGASALVLASESALGGGAPYTPLARVRSFACNAVAPMDFGMAPTGAIRAALAKAALRPDDIALWEINEAFAVVPLANIKTLGIDPARVNTRGGGVSLGHPIGSSGSRIVVTLLHALKPGEKGVAAVCNGGGAATALVIERL